MEQAPGPKAKSTDWRVRRNLLRGLVLLLLLSFLLLAGRALFPRAQVKRARQRQVSAPRARQPRALPGTSALTTEDLVRPSATVHRLSTGTCIRTVEVLPASSCTLPGCSSNSHQPTLSVFDAGNGSAHSHVALLRFDLGALRPPSNSSIIDVELELEGTRRCRAKPGRKSKGADFTHQLLFLRSDASPKKEVAAAQAQPHRLLAQWGPPLHEAKFWLPLRLSNAQLKTFLRLRQLALALVELQPTNDWQSTDRRGRLQKRSPRESCAYMSSRAEETQWPRLKISFAFDCCHGKRGTSSREAHVARSDKMNASSGAHRDPSAHASKAEKQFQNNDSFASMPLRPQWIHDYDWTALREERLPSMTWLSRVSGQVPTWVADSAADASAGACVRPHARSDARGGQLAPPRHAQPLVSFIVAYHNNEALTARCLDTLFACASEVSSAEYLVVDDGSDVVSGELPPLLAALANDFGIRYELARYPVAVGFTMAVSEAARRANGSFLLLLNNDAFVQKGALAAMLATFEVHADVGVVGAKLVGANATVLESGAIVWADGTGSWFSKNTSLGSGRDDEARNHRVGYARETDYVSAACAMVPATLFREYRMFDLHFSPGYYEDTDLAFTARAAGLRTLYQPFALVYHAPHSTYLTDTQPLIVRNRAHFVSKHATQLAQHLPSCVVPASCTGASRGMYTHLAATRLYSYRLLWVDMILPEPDRDSGSVRTMVMLKLLIAMRCHVSIVTVQRSGGGRHERYSRYLRFLGVRVLPSLKSLTIRGSREPFDFIIVARRDTYQRVSGTLLRYYPTTPIAFDTVDLHFNREAARAAFVSAHAADKSLLWSIFGNLSLPSSEQRILAREAELDAVSAAAVAIVVSESERRALNSALAESGRAAVPVVVIANAHEMQPQTTARMQERSGVVFIGNFNHLPNRDAVLFFATEVLPHLLKDPRVSQDKDFVFHVVGANALPVAIAKLNGTDGSGGGSARVVVHGYVPRLRDLYGRMRVSVAPLRWGAGVKGKVNTANLLGVPVVATSVAVDGMHATDGKHVLVADTPERMAEQVLLAYYNETAWRRLVRQGRVLVERRAR